MIEPDNLCAQEIIARKLVPRDSLEVVRTERASGGEASRSPSLVAALVTRGLLQRPQAERLLRDLKSEWPSVIDIDRLLPPEAPPGSEDEEWIGGDEPIDPSLFPKP